MKETIEKLFLYFLSFYFGNYDEEKPYQHFDIKALMIALYIAILPSILDFLYMVESFKSQFLKQGW